MLEMRKELDGLRQQNQILTRSMKKEKCERQVLEANKLKYTMMKELVECRGEIEADTFFDNKKKGEQNTNGNLQNQIIEQRQANHKASLAHKYGMLWLNKVRTKRQKRENIKVFTQ